jgi:hypothetical protein
MVTVDPICCATTKLTNGCHLLEREEAFLALLGTRPTLGAVTLDRPSTWLISMVIDEMTYCVTTYMAETG